MGQATYFSRVNYGADYLFLSCCRPDTIGPPLIPNYPQLPVRPRCPQYELWGRLPISLEL